MLWHLPIPALSFDQVLIGSYFYRSMTLFTMGSIGQRYCAFTIPIYVITAWSNKGMFFFSLVLMALSSCHPHISTNAPKSYLQEPITYPGFQWAHKCPLRSTAGDRQGCLILNVIPWCTLLKNRAIKTESAQLGELLNRQVRWYSQATISRNIKAVKPLYSTSWMCSS